MQGKSFLAGLLGFCLGIALSIVFWGDPDSNFVGPVSEVEAGPRNVIVREPDLYTLYLVDSQEQAKEVQEWLLYGETVVVSGQALTRVDAFRDWYGDKKIQIMDLRAR